MRSSAVSIVSQKRPATSTQFAALPYRVVDQKIEILLITSRRTKRWIVPKGWPIEGMSPSASAAREALEEAGISGGVQTTPIGHFHYLKEYPQRTDIMCRVEVFAMRVTRQRKDWQERHARNIKWFSAVEAARMVEEPQLRKLITEFAAQAAADLSQH